MEAAQIQALADKVLRAELGRFGYQGAEVHSGFDHSEEPAVYIAAILGVNAPPLEGATLIDAHVALSRALLAAGEDRFPYLRTKRVAGGAPDDIIIGTPRGRS